MLLVDLHSEICLNEEDLREGSELPHAEGGWWVHVYCTVRVERGCRVREGHRRPHCRSHGVHLGLDF
jgi:hypothetical protein